MGTITTSATSKEMLNYFMQLNEKEKQSVVNLLKTFLINRKENPVPQSIEEYNQEIEMVDAEIARGDYVKHEEVMKRYLAK